MKILLDTCAISEVRKPSPDGGVLEAFSRLSNDDLFISVVSIGEISRGVDLLAEGKRKSSLRKWFDSLKCSHRERILPVSVEIACLWGELTATAQRQGRVVSVGDGLIAATARFHGLRIMTRNVPDFKPTGALLTNPWTEQ